MPYINAIGTAVPAFKHQQTDILRFMLSAETYLEDEARRLSLMYHRSGISFRHSVLPDYSSTKDGYQFYPKTPDLEPFPSVSQRMNFFETHALTLAQAAIEDLHFTKPLTTFTHLITVSCTGLMAPGLDIQLMESLDLSPTIVRNSVNFMGCYAAIHALKLADAFCRADANAQVLVVCTELCTLHFQKGKSMDTQTSNLLFSDGAAACIVSNHPHGKRIEGFYSEVVLEGKNDMSWKISEHGFLMKLSNEVPKLLEASIQKMILNALSSNNLTLDQITNWAIHPGGKSILEAIQRAMKLESTASDTSFEVLRNYGNMSSVTILFVLKKLFSTNNDGNTFAVAFGPGITMESMMLA
ncbi:putative naringenin-chalcone synthase [Runella defluvii]|uniref:Putative naringenin-chalcone synthase n=1 Tax=Runella defluvii TaxID=370973 RepID=A0A7W5ZLP3_9BACT|nr:type III polyketide synthase [Runella defluvii]MBB3839692.1 putative naringenin-chalcone synthase [Runella defluvii]